MGIEPIQVHMLCWTLKSEAYLVQVEILLAQFKAHPQVSSNFKSGAVWLHDLYRETEYLLF